MSDWFLRLLGFKVVDPATLPNSVRILQKQAKLWVDNAEFQHNKFVGELEMNVNVQLLKKRALEKREEWAALAHEYLWDRAQNGGWEYNKKGQHYAVPESSLSRARRRVYKEAVAYFAQIRELV